MLTFKRLHSFSFTLFTVKITQMINAIKIAWKRNYFPVASPLVYLTYKKKPNDKINLFFFWFVFFLNSFQTSESDSEPIVSNARVTLNWYGQGPGGWGVFWMLVWIPVDSFFSSALRGICVLFWDELQQQPFYSMSCLCRGETVNV